MQWSIRTVIVKIQLTAVFTWALFLTLISGRSYRGYVVTVGMRKASALQSAIPRGALCTILTNVPSVPLRMILVQFAMSWAHLSGFSQQVAVPRWRNFHFSSISIRMEILFCLVEDDSFGVLWIWILSFSLTPFFGFSSPEQGTGGENEYELGCSRRVQENLSFVGRLEF